MSQTSSQTFENLDDDDDDDDFTWHQDEEHDFRFGLNITQTVRKDPPLVKQSQPTTSKKTVCKKTEREYSDSDITLPSDIEYDGLETEPEESGQKSRAVSNKGKKYKKHSEANEFVIKKDSEEMQEAKKKKLTGKKACKFCATIFKSQKEVEKHKCQYLECNDDQFICRVCHKTLARSAFSRHMSYVHGEAKFQCDICSRQFKDRRKLISHISTHTGDRAFKCEVEGCKASFTNNYGLLRHMGKF